MAVVAGLVLGGFAVAVVGAAFDSRLLFAVGAVLLVAGLVQLVYVMAPAFV